MSDYGGVAFNLIYPIRRQAPRLPVLELAGLVSVAVLRASRSELARYQT